MKQIYDLLIIGAGPIGIEAGLYAAELGLNFHILEQGQICDSLRNWGFVKLFSPASMNVSSLGKDVSGFDCNSSSETLTGDESYRQYYNMLVKSKKLKDRITTNSKVVSIVRDGLLKSDYIGVSKRKESPFRITTVNSSNTKIYYSHKVIDASGVYRSPNRLGIGNTPVTGEEVFNDKIFYHLQNLTENDSNFTGKKLLVVGNGHSACNTMLMLREIVKNSKETKVFWLTRSNENMPVQDIADDPLPERSMVVREATQMLTNYPEQVEYLKYCHVDSIEKGNECFQKVNLQYHDGKKDSLEVDYIFANVGFHPDISIFRELQIHLCYASEGPMNLAAHLLSQNSTDCLNINSAGAEILKNPEPDFYILGAKSYGRTSNFLIKEGLNQIRDCFQLITGNEKLDLYNTTVNA